MNKYKNWYNNITKSAQSRITDEYTETHHIVPKSLGGTEDVNNLTKLTAREHFICHWLLTKIYPDGEEHWKMINAFRMMRAENPKQQRYKTKITSRVYANIKEEYSKLQSERVSGKNNPMYGDKFYRSEEGKESQRMSVIGDKNGSKQEQSRIKISNSKKGKNRNPFTEEWKKNLSKNHKSKQPGFNGALSEETKEKMREKALGRKQDADTIKRKADSIRGLKREKKQCPHCQQLVAVNGYARWHGDNCKNAK